MIRTFLFVDKDGTEKVSNQFPFKGDEYPETNRKFDLGYPYPDEFKDKWYTEYSHGAYPIPIFTGVVLPKGTIKRLIGKDLTWDNKPYEM